MTKCRAKSLAIIARQGRRCLWGQKDLILIVDDRTGESRMLPELPGDATLAPGRIDVRVGIPAENQQSRRVLGIVGLVRRPTGPITDKSAASRIVAPAAKTALKS